MSAGPLRRLAQGAGALVERVYPRSEAGWARAMRCEIEQVEDDRAAFLFALGCLWGGCRSAAAHRLSSARKGALTMILDLARLSQPRGAGIACAVAATSLGLFHLWAAGAPARYLVVNAAALLLGIVALRGIAGAPPQAGRFVGPVLLALGASLFATALLGASADGASRWIFIGPLAVQLSLVVVPLMIVLFARRPDALGTAGIAVAAAALALQPDRAMAGVLALAAALVAATRPGRSTIAAFAAAAAGFALALGRPDALPAVPHVDRILFTAFEVHLLAGAAVLFGALLLPLPALAGWRRDPGRRHVHLAFGATWLGCVAAAALGNYPTPVVGYGGSAILGYLLSLAALPTAVRAPSGRAPAALPDEVQRGSGVGRQALAT